MFDMRLALSTLLTLTLSGCIGFGTKASDLPAALSMPRDKAYTVAEYVIHWPRAIDIANASKGARWVSPSTMSVVITSDSKMIIVNAPKTSDGDVTTAIKFAAPVGRDMFKFALYDRRQSAGTSPMGNVVGEATVVQTLVADKTNLIRARIAGTVAQVSIAPATNQPFITGTDVGGFELIGDTPEELIADRRRCRWKPTRSSAREPSPKEFT